jgi:hypothetical protein
VNLRHGEATGEVSNNPIESREAHGGELIRAAASKPVTPMVLRCRARTRGTGGGGGFGVARARRRGESGEGEERGATTVLGALF